MSAAAIARKLSPLGDRVLVKRIIQEAKVCCCSSAQRHAFAGRAARPQLGRRRSRRRIRAARAAALC
jgi:hypothetical protein